MDEWSLEKLRLLLPFLQSSDARTLLSDNNKLRTVYTYLGGSLRNILAFVTQCTLDSDDFADQLCRFIDQKATELVQMGVTPERVQAEPSSIFIHQKPMETFRKDASPPSSSPDRWLNVRYWKIRGDRTSSVRSLLHRSWLHRRVGKSAAALMFEQLARGKVANAGILLENSYLNHLREAKACFITLRNSQLEGMSARDEYISNLGAVDFSADGRVYGITFDTLYIPILLAKQEPSLASGNRHEIQPEALYNAIKDFEQDSEVVCIYPSIENMKDHDFILYFPPKQANRARVLLAKSAVFEREHTLRKEDSESTAQIAKEQLEGKIWQEGTIALIQLKSGENVTSSHVYQHARAVADVRKKLRSWMEQQELSGRFLTSKNVNVFGMVIVSGGAEKNTGNAELKELINKGIVGVVGQEVADSFTLLARPEKVNLCLL